MCKHVFIQLACTYLFIEWDAIWLLDLLALYITDNPYR